MFLNVSAAAVGSSAAVESGVSLGLVSATVAVAESLTAVLPMGADLDSALFAAALNAAGAALIGVAFEHSSNRESFAVDQQVAAVTYTASDITSNAALAL